MGAVTGVEAGGSLAAARHGDPTMSEQRADIYARITKEIIAAIETGAGEWKMPWHHDGASATRPTNVATGRRYRGINTLALWAAAVHAGYAQGLWGTYRQFQAVGAQVRQGEKATTVVLWKEGSTNGNDGDDTDDDARGHRRMFARAFSVFNVAQVDGYEIKPAALALSEDERHAQAETFLTNLDIKTVFGGPEACYQPWTDAVLMPSYSQFRDAASFYGVWTHENGHASGAKHRLDRDLTGRFGSAAYALEEIVVELLSGLILADLAIAHHPRPDHAAYVASWLKVLKNDPKAIFTAASKAQHAADWMHAQQPDANSSSEEAA